MDQDAIPFAGWMPTYPWMGPIWDHPADVKQGLDSTGPLIGD
jgi:hypothetical protein